MPLLTLPLFAWGTPSDISASPWVDVNTPVVTGSVADPFGGTGAYTIDDNSAAGVEARRLPMTVGSGRIVAAVCIKAGTATVSRFGLRDDTAAAWLHVLTATWSGGVPTVATESGTGTVYGTIGMGSGWYLVLFDATGATGANDNELYLYGASGTVADTGTTSYYIRHMVLTDYLVDAIGADRDEEGSDYRRGPSGVEEAWSTGTVYTLGATIGWIPSAPRSNPVVVSGWPGGGESTGVNCGIATMLRAGRNAQALTFVYDRSACSTYNTCYLEEPREPRPELEPDNQNEKRIAIRLRSSTAFADV